MRTLSGDSWAAWVRVVVKKGVAEAARVPPQPSPTCTSAPLCYGGVLWGATYGKTHTDMTAGRDTHFLPDQSWRNNGFTTKSHLYYFTLYLVQTVYCIHIKISVSRAEFYEMDFALICYSIMIEILWNLWKTDIDMDSLYRIARFLRGGGG